MTVSYSQKFEAIRRIVEDPRPRALSKLVFIRLLIYLNHRTMQCNPSQETLACNLGCTARSVRSALSQLRELGYITDVLRSHTRLVNQYELWVPSGKNVHGDGENLRSNYRNVDSAKEIKKKIKEADKSRSRSSNAARARRQDLLAPNDKAQLALEREIQKHFPCKEDGLRLLFELPKAELEELRRKIVSGEQTAKVAVLRLIQDVGSFP